MKRFVLVAIAVLLAPTDFAQAAQILSPPLPGLMLGQALSAACYVRNTGTTPVNVEVSLITSPPSLP